MGEDGGEEEGHVRKKEGGEEELVERGGGRGVCQSWENAGGDKRKS